MAQQEMVKDWRGNKYPLHEPVGRDCEAPSCTKSAVRHVCKAENYEDRTHWHGAIHTERFGLAFFCLGHGEHLRATDPHQTRYDNVPYTRRHW